MRLAATEKEKIMLYFFQKNIIRSLFLVEKRCDIYFWSSSAATDVYYSLLELVKKVLQSFNIFCVGGSRQKLFSDWLESTNG